MMMPDLNGDEVLRIIKGNPETRDVSVVVLSADTDTERVAKCIEIGADDYLPKPFNPTILRARIRPSCASARCGRWKANTSDASSKRRSIRKPFFETFFRRRSPRACVMARPILRTISKMPQSYSRMWSALPRSRLVCGHSRSSHASIGYLVNSIGSPMRSAAKRSRPSATATWRPSDCPLRGPTMHE